MEAGRKNPGFDAIVKEQVLQNNAYEWTSLTFKKRVPGPFVQGRRDDGDLKYRDKVCRGCD
jgi:hypothetical protein